MSAWSTASDARMASTLMCRGRRPVTAGHCVDLLTHEADKPGWVLCTWLLRMVAASRVGYGKGDWDTRVLRCFHLWRLSVFVSNETFFGIGWGILKKCLRLLDMASDPEPCFGTKQYSVFLLFEVRQRRCYQSLACTWCRSFDHLAGGFLHTSPYIFILHFFICKW